MATMNLSEPHASAPCGNEHDKKETDKTYPEAGAEAAEPVAEPEAAQAAAGSVECRFGSSLAGKGCSSIMVTAHTWRRNASALLSSTADKVLRVAE